jgi:hypothetical protein
MVSIKPNSATVVVALLLVAISAGCLGFFSGYGDAAKEITSADHVIGNYQDFLRLYNQVCAVGSMTVQHQAAFDEFLELKGDPAGWSRSDNMIYSQLRTDLTSTTNQYNALVGKYNKKTEDKTVDFTKIQGLPERIRSYNKDTVLTNDDTIDESVLKTIFG